MARRESFAGALVSELVQAALDEGRKLKDSLARRSITVITSSGTLVALTLGVSALTTRAPAFAVPGAALACMAVALGLLFAAALLALLNTAPWRQGAMDLDAFAERPTTALDWRAAEASLRPRPTRCGCGSRPTCARATIDGAATSPSRWYWKCAALTAPSVGTGSSCSRDRDRGQGAAGRSGACLATQRLDGEIETVARALEEPGCAIAPSASGSSSPATGVRDGCASASEAQHGHDRR
jgi:hypothetical protein